MKKRIIVRIESLDGRDIYMNTPSFEVQRLSKLIARIETAIRKDQGEE